MIPIMIAFNVNLIEFDLIDPLKERKGMKNQLN